MHYYAARVFPGKCTLATAQLTSRGPIVMKDPSSRITRSAFAPPPDLPAIRSVSPLSWSFRVKEPFFLLIAISHEFRAGRAEGSCTRGGGRYPRERKHNKRARFGKLGAWHARGGAEFPHTGNNLAGRV